MANERDGRTAARETADQMAGGFVAVVLGILAGPLPPSWRGRRQIDVESMRAASALLQAVLGLVLFYVGLIAWNEAQFDAVMAAAETEAARRGGDVELELKMRAAYTLAGNPLWPVVYALTNPVGFVLALTLAGGLIRSLHVAMAEENLPDPTLLAIDWIRRKISKRAADASRERRKGEAAPDRLIAGDGSQGWHLRLVTRDDHPWREGNDVYFEDGAYRVVSVQEVRGEAGRLRMRYDFRRLAAAEAARGRLFYRPAQPPIVEGIQPPG